MAGDRARLRDHPQLVALSVGLAVVETVVVWIAAPHSGLALAPQVDRAGALRRVPRPALAPRVPPVVARVLRRGTAVLRVPHRRDRVLGPLRMAHRRRAADDARPRPAQRGVDRDPRARAAALRSAAVRDRGVLAVVAVLRGRAGPRDARRAHAPGDRDPEVVARTPGARQRRARAGELRRADRRRCRSRRRPRSDLGARGCTRRPRQRVVLAPDRAGHRRARAHAAPAPVRPRRPGRGARARARRYRDRVRGLDRARVVARPDPGRRARRPGRRCWW